MKKYLKSKLLLAAALVSATMFVACGEDKTEELDPGQKEEPTVKVEMGHYKLEFPDLVILEWPDKQAGIEEQYNAYQKSIIDALKYEEGKQYKWSDIEADKDRLQKIFDGFQGFEYSVKAAGNFIQYTAGNIAFSAVKDGSTNSGITFGERKIKVNVIKGENETCQLYVVITSYEAKVPSAQEYCTNVKKLFTDALKDVFTNEYDKVELTGSHAHTEYYNLANFTGNSSELKESVTTACDAVVAVVPALPENVLQEIQTNNPSIPYIFDITIMAYDLENPVPNRTEKVVFNHKIK